MVFKKLSVVVPCFNEGKTICENIKKINSYLSDRISTFEIIAVNDGSTDNTLLELQQIREEIPIKIINDTENSGKGKAVRDGILSASDESEVVMFLDADLGIPIEELEKFLEELEKGADIVIASRFVPGLRVMRPVLLHRRIMEKVFRLLRKIILNNWKIEDTQCGFKVFKKEVAKKIFAMATIERFAFDSEIMFIAKKLGYRIKELPVSLQNPAQTSVRILFDPINMFFALLKIRAYDMTGKYKWK
jgi:glycosyltransferase involved in cell wall biosynthesis